MELLYILPLVYLFIATFRSVLKENKICVDEKNILQKKLDKVNLYLYLNNITIDYNKISDQTKPLQHNWE